MTEQIEGKNPSAHLQALGLELTLACPAACRSCAYDCDPRRGHTMTEAQAKSVLNHADRLHFNRTIAFTGGEPFLRYDLLKSLSAHVKERLGYKLTVSTNCYWAATPKRAREIMAEMSELGLAYLLVSMDDFHQEYIDLKRVENGVRAAMDRGIYCVIQSIETRSSRKLGWYRKNLDLPSEDELIRWNVIPCDPVGRAARAIPEADLLLNWKKQPGCCSALRAFIVNSDGSVSNCCGTGNKMLPDMGNAFEEPLPVIFNRVNADPLLNALAAWGGPFLLMDILAENGMPDYGQGSYTSPCHACHRIFQDPRAMAILDAHLAPRQAELVATRLIAQVQHNEWKAGPKTEDLYVLGTWYQQTTDP